MRPRTSAGATTAVTEVATSPTPSSTVAAASQSERPRLCSLPKDTGSCQRYQRKYYYDPETNTCNLFRFGGCGVRLTLCLRFCVVRKLE